MKKNRFLVLAIIVALAVGLLGGYLLWGGGSETPQPDDPVPQNDPPQQQQVAIAEDGSYYSKDDVALYIHTYGHLPDNYVTKKEARKAGWSSGSVQKYIPGAAIGGDVFSNREGLLPKKKGRTYYECDIDTNGKKQRGDKRIIYSNDGLIFYTEDHYQSFEQLYGD